MKTNWSQKLPHPNITEKELVDILTMFNKNYRAGEPLVDDWTYDHIWLKKLEQVNRKHPFLNTIEPE